MLTKNFKNILANTLTRLNSGCYTGLPVVSVDNRMRYTGANYPNNVTITGTLDATAAGISVGRSNIPATEFDYNLGDTITSGITINTIQNEYGYKNNDAYIDYIVTITNTSSEIITINEIGYKQSIYASTKPFSYVTSISSLSQYIFLIDHTILDTPVIIQPGDAGTIHYRIKTIYNSKIISGIEIVDWAYGDDDKIATMLAAAQQGTIDLQRDAEWQVGQMRYINIDSFTAGGKTFNSQRLGLIISSFEEYENCGNVIQLDFYDTPGSIRMNSTSSNAYNTSEMYTSSLPAFEAALPSWLRQLLRTFNVKVGAGNNSSEIITVGNNKLALRSATEIMGTASAASLIEGEQIQVYKNNNNYQYKYNINSCAYWLRTPYSTNRYYYITSSIGLSYSNTTSTQYLAPFMCI